MTRRWRSHLIAFALSLLVLVALYAPTLWSMVEIWWRSETFAHGFFVIPISVWLIWRCRDSLRRLPPRPEPLVLIPLLAIGFLWALGNAAEVQVVKQFAFVALIPVLVWLHFGRAIAWEIAFPLGFLFMAVPAGEWLIPHLMDFTAHFSVACLRLTGMPVFFEGTTLTIPSGTWSVVKACSGIRYLIAIVMVSLLFGYLSYRSWWRRAVFLVVGVALAIVGNGLRAFLIVMIGHLSGMRLAVGIDHIIYGWLFFGLLIFALLSLGHWWQEPEPAALPASGPDPGRSGVAADVGARAPAMVLLMSMGVLLLWPVLERVMEHAGGLVTTPVVPTQIAGWEAGEQFTDWTPHYTGYNSMASQSYRRGDQKVGLVVLWYANQEQGHELVNSDNVLVPEKNLNLLPISRDTRRLQLPDRQLDVATAMFRSGTTSLMIWRSDWVAGRWTANEIEAKATEALARLFRGDKRAAAVMVYTTMDQDAGAALENSTTTGMLTDFLAAMLPVLDKEFQRSRPEHD